MFIDINSKKNRIAFKLNSKSKDKSLNIDVPFRLHFDELKQRNLHLLFLFLTFTFLAFFEIRYIVQFLEIPVKNIRFFQMSPGEYFLETLKIAFYTGIIFLGPIILAQITFFISPALTFSEKSLIVPLICISILLFATSLGFAYFCLIPAALQFFIVYSKDVIEPLWSFTQYCDFIIVLFFTTAIVFQIPIFQIIIGILGIISSKDMLKFKKYIVLASVILSAILTPSTDPITQLLLSSAIISLYFLGAGVLIILKR